MSSQDNKTFIEVYVRLRSLTKTETEKKTKPGIYVVPPDKILLEYKRKDRRFNFDYVFGPKTLQFDIYNKIVAPMIPSVIGGFNCTVFAFGQKATGKTYTIFGDLSGTIEDRFNKDESPVGIVLRASQHLFSKLSKLDPKTEYTVRVSFVELYNEEVRDLLNDCTSLRIYDDPLYKGSVCLKELLKVTVLNTQDVLDWLNIGLKQCQNASSQAPRSHLLFTFFVDVRKVLLTGEEVIRTGKLQLAVVADSENIVVKNKDATLALIDVIKAISNKWKHVPFRKSKLTRILQDSLGGNTKTAMIITISPNVEALDKTVANLEVGHSAKSIQNNAIENITKKQINYLQELNNEIEKLKADLEATRRRQGCYVSPEKYKKMENEVKSNDKILTLIRKICDLEQHASDLNSQYENMLKSFDDTKQYLEKKKVILQKVQEEERQIDNQLNGLSKEHEQLHETASNILNICDDATKHEDLFYKKFQTRCNSNMSNVEISNDMLTVTLSSMENIQEISHNNLQQNVNYSSDLTTTQQYFFSEYSNDLKLLKELSERMRTNKDTFLLQFEQITKNSDIDLYVSMKTLVTQVYEHHLEQVETHMKFIEALEEMKNIQTSLIFLKEKIASVLAVFKKSINLKESRSSLERNLASTMSNHFGEKKRKLINQIKKDKAETERVRRTVADLEKQKLEADAENEFLQHLYNKISDLLNQHKKENVINNVQSATEYLTTVNKAYEHPRTICSQILGNINQSQETIQKNKERLGLRDYFSEYFVTVGGNLAGNNDEFIGVLSNCNALLKGFQQGVIAEGITASSSIELELKQKQKSQVSQMNEIRKNIETTFSTLETLNSSIRNVGPDGNTPPRRIYNLPKKLYKKS